MIGVNLVGILDPKKTDPDDFVILEKAPHGFLSFSGGAWSSSYEWNGIVDCQVTLGKKAVKFLMTVDQARDMLHALQEAIRDADESKTDQDVFDEDFHGNAIEAGLDEKCPNTFSSAG